MRRALFIDCFEIIFAVFVCSMTFFDYSELDHHFSEYLQYLIGILAAGLLVITLLRNRFDLTGMAEKYAQGAKRSYRCKSYLNQKCGYYENHPLPSEEYERIIQELDKIMEGSEPIPESKFNKLRYDHIKKQKFGRFIEENNSRTWIGC